MCKTSLVVMIIAASWQLLSCGHGGAQARGAGGGANSSEPAFFIFGDSLLDAGNNNYIASLSRADWRPYGVDFAPSGFQPTGRFTNGRTISDIIGQHLGQNGLPRPYLALRTHGEALLNGVNYASGAGGILNSTGAIFVERLSFDTQIDYFENTKGELVNMLGYQATMQFLKKSMFFIGIGSNDYLDNYLLPNSETKSRYSPQGYEQFLITRLHHQLDMLYMLGARKFIVSGLGPLGCIPYQLSNGGSVGGECIDTTNRLIIGFNNRLKILVSNLNSNISMASFVYLNSYYAVSDLIRNYQNHGFSNVNTACCGSGGQFKGRVSCLTSSPYCGEDRHTYLFFDAYHPSGAANLILAARFLDGGSNYVFPMNIRQLFAL